MYNYAGLHLASQGGLFDVQHSNMGMLEIDPPTPLTGTVAGTAASAVGFNGMLMLALQSFDVPGRNVGKADLHYLQGVSHYPTKPDGLGDITVTYRDFVNSPIRGILQMWHSLTYDESTGIMMPTSLLKTTGHVVLFGTTGTLQREADLYGIWLQDAPKVSVDFGKGDAMVMQMKLACDRIVWRNTLWLPVG
jgi:hypothetical protein